MKYIKPTDDVNRCVCVIIKTVCYQTTILNKHLHDLMGGLTAKVFRTYNASHTLQEQLNILTEGQ
jgi:hypothetical protein